MIGRYVSCAAGLALALASHFGLSSQAAENPSAAANAAAQLQPRTFSSFLADRATHVKVPGTCNSVVFSQIPTRPDYFLGRRGTNGGTCADVNPKSLALFEMDWGTATLRFTKYVLNPFFQISTENRLASIENVYDPSVVSYNNELWVAFECAVKGFLGASTCVGPLNLMRRTSTGGALPCLSRLGMSTQILNIVTRHPFPTWLFLIRGSTYIGPQYKWQRARATGFESQYGAWNLRRSLPVRVGFGVLGPAE
jgi:hypothetical protein